jgi:hypothetical protein
MRGLRTKTFNQYRAGSGMLRIVAKGGMGRIGDMGKEGTSPECERAVGNLRIRHWAIQSVT